MRLLERIASSSVTHRVPYDAVNEAATAERDLLSSLAEGDAEALGIVYDRHHDHVRAFAQRLLGDDAAAEDLVHDVFVALPRAIRRYRGDCSLRTYLVAIAANTSRHAIRAAIRRRSALARLAREPEGYADPPDADLARRTLSEALTRALDQLSDDQRLAFVLCEVEERTSREVAVIVDAPEATVRTRLFHARQKLRSILEREGIR